MLVFNLIFFPLSQPSKKHTNILSNCEYNRQNSKTAALIKAPYKKELGVSRDQLDFLSFVAFNQM